MDHIPDRGVATFQLLATDFKELVCLQCFMKVATVIMIITGEVKKALTALYIKGKAILGNESDVYSKSKTISR